MEKSPSQSFVRYKEFFTKELTPRTFESNGVTEEVVHELAGRLNKLADSIQRTANAPASAAGTGAKELAIDVLKQCRSLVEGQIMPRQSTYKP